MSYIQVPYTTYLRETLALLANPGLFLVAAGRNGKPNAMTIGWGTVGIVWGKPVFIVLVRPSRYTHTLLEASDSFTVGVPSQAQHEAVAFCGAHSGRDCDKFRECGLETLPSLRVRTPGIAGCPVIYECRIVHTNEVIPANLAGEIRARSYPSGDYHRVYFGEILLVRALPDAAELLRT
ncbi:MAG: flavin reductase family protein [Anaerolineae bacterium]